jgi:hypothetical protein
MEFSRCVMMDENKETEGHMIVYVTLVSNAGSRTILELGTKLILQSTYLSRYSMSSFLFLPARKL